MSGIILSFGNQIEYTEEHKCLRPVLEYSKRYPVYSGLCKPIKDVFTD